MVTDIDYVAEEAWLKHARHDGIKKSEEEYEDWRNEFKNAFVAGRFDADHAAAMCRVCKIRLHYYTPTLLFGDPLTDFYQGWTEALIAQHEGLDKR